MNEIKELILEYFKQHGKFITEEELKRKLKITKEKQTTLFLQALESLVEDGGLFFDPKKGYHLFQNELGIAYGTIEINKTGNGYIHTDDGYSIFIKKEDLNGALNGDKVVVDSIVYHNETNYRGVIKQVVKRETGHVIYEVVCSGKDITLKPHNPNEQVPLYINKTELKKLVDGELVLIEVGTTLREGAYIGTINKVIGHKNDADIDIRLIYEEFDIPIEFSASALEETSKLPIDVSEEELIGRVDLRDKPIITIDCDDTKDRDDAVYVELLPNGNYKLYVSISHLTHYISKDSSLYKEASTRSTSHYPLNTCNPMFPPKLSNGIGSLNENVDRLTRTCEIEFDQQGNIVNYDIYISVINSKKAMKYSEVNRVLEGETVPGYEPFTEQLQLMSKLCDLLEKKREQRNYVDFGILDIEVIQSPNGDIEQIIESPTGKAQKIIENFMLITGTTIAEHYSWLPFIYRIHESPNPDTVINVIKILKIAGFELPTYHNINEATIKNIIEKVGTREEAKLVKKLLLQSMKRARYSTDNIGHFALQLPKYCHFTSPIRRFTDFRIHMLLDEVESLDYSPESIKILEQELTEIATRASSIQKKAQVVEQESLKMAMAKKMEKNIGQGYDATITNVTPYGIFVETTEKISGKVRFDAIDGDRYMYDEKEKAAIGKKYKKKYQIFDKVYVVVTSADKVARTIDFEITTKPKTLTKTPLK